MNTMTGSPVENDLTARFSTMPTVRSRVQVAFGCGTHPGHVRSRNEDQYLIAKLAKSMRICASSLPGSETTRFSDEEGYLLIVADGMGGTAGGQEASTMAVETVESFVLDVIKWFLHREGQEQNALVHELRQAFQRADSDVLARADADPKLFGMGTTLTMAFSVGSELFVAHAGDSRAYLYRKGALERITSDHTLVQVLVDAGAITPEDAREHPRRHVVTNVLGGPNSGVDVEVHRRCLADGDILLLCTDGLTEYLQDSELAEVLEHATDPQEVAHRLLRVVLARPAQDNVTLALARYTIT
jgi:PPM family protein phosphatase